MTLYIIKYTDKDKHLHTIAARTLTERNQTLYEIHKQGYSAELETVEA